MSHNANAVLLGTTRNTDRTVTNRAGAIEAGLAVRLKNDGTITTAKADGDLLGVSLGKDLSNTSRTAICRKGEEVPVRLTAGFTPVLGAICYIDNTTGKAAASATDSTATAATFTSLLTDGAILEDGSSSVIAAIIDFPGGL